MIERRRTTRSRTYLGGRISYNQQFSTIDCLVRNLSAEGARLELSGAVALPGEIDLAIAQHGSTHRARFVWRRADEAGIVFVEPHARPGVIPIGLARRLRDIEAENQRLRENIRSPEPVECD